MEQAIRVRYATAADITAIVALVESAYRGPSSRVGWTTEADLLDGQRVDAEGVAQVIEPPHSVVLLLEDADGLLACAHVARRDAAGWFGMFAVRPSAQGRGTGRRLLAAAERHARSAWQVTRMRMFVIVQREALIDWYQRRGYRRTGEYAPFPYGNERFGKPRRDDLRFERLEKRLDYDEEPGA